MEWLVPYAGMEAVARQFWEFFGNQKIFAFHGDMGAGKTTFINVLCQVKKVDGGTASPSYSIINAYDYPGGRIFHMDLYRLQDEEEAYRAGVEECLYSGEICLVEWPEKAPAIFPPDTVHICIVVVDSETRKIHTEPSSQFPSNSI